MDKNSFTSVKNGRKRKFRILAGVVFLAAVIGLFVFFSIWNKPPLNVEDSKAVLVSAPDLFKEYSADEKVANTKYIDKVVEVNGTVNSISKNSEGKTVVLLKTEDPMFGVNCTLEKEANISEGEQVSLKGICTGYLTDVVLIRCYKTK